ncbi:hypothetical protein QZH56_18595 [Streptomyces olivoreticuli]|uniref:hypothetical protein n=1 Tax=Streptomyces olivoreticuli TaxID=68246 RepID=UPI0026588A79|nr:hypothetical protein [Streptomyces olivoreticuli]WKK20909.1 hypothetical protein QZH56_18595 [Streptomyces olivoreticuli]
MSTTGAGAWKGSAEKGEDHLELTAEQNRVVTARWEMAKEARGRLDGLMRDLEGRSIQHGGKLEGLDYSLKGLDSFRRKAAVAVERPGVDAESVCEDVDDLNRYTLTFETDNYVQGTKQTYAELRARGFEPVAEQNTWEDPVYKGVNTAWERPESKEKFELQFHTPESFKAKSDNHELYELTRSGEFKEIAGDDDKLAREYKEAADLLQNERYENVRTPPGVEELDDRLVRAELNPKVGPQIVQEVRHMETNLKATHAAAAAAAANAQQPRNSLGSNLGESLHADGPGLRDRLATKTEPARLPAAQATAVDLLPTQSRGRGPRL